MISEPGRLSDVSGDGFLIVFLINCYCEQMISEPGRLPDVSGDGFYNFPNNVFIRNR
jgi:hypothetical protein